MSAVIMPVEHEIASSMSIPADPLLATYKRAPMEFVRGEGVELIDAEGKRYLDLASGIAVNALGYADSGIAAKIADALSTGLIHTSNLYRTSPGEQLAAKLVDLSFASRVFFCNSGAEANEGAFKVARKWARKIGTDAKVEIIALRGSFHGRLFASLAATDRPSYRAPFRPLGGGLPMGAVLVTEEIGSTMQPGDHGTTFGGGPLVASVAGYVLDRLSDPSLLAAVRGNGAWLGEQLMAIASRSTKVRAVRGMGYMWGIDVVEPASEIVKRGWDEGLLILSAGEHTLRLLPPLVMTRGDLERGLSIIERIIG